MDEPVAVFAVDNTGLARAMLLDKDYRGVNYGYEWLPEILESLKQLYKAGQIPFSAARSRIHKDNVPALKVMDKSGCVMVGTDGDFTLWEYKLG
jgi:hypothetical protein